MAMFSNLRCDAASYAKYGGWLRAPGFWIVAIYRLGMWSVELPQPLRLLFWLVYRLLHLSYFFFNVHMWAGARGSRLGSGLCLIHPNNIYVGPGVRIGRNCLIHHEVTLGFGHVPGTPQIGDNVTLYPGARILGGVQIHDDAVVGAKCVVVRDVAKATIVMPPANRHILRSLSPTARAADNRDKTPTLPD